MGKPAGPAVDLVRTAADAAGYWQPVPVLFCPHTTLPDQRYIIGSTAGLGGLQLVCASVRTCGTS